MKDYGVKSNEKRKKNLPAFASGPCARENATHTNKLKPHIKARRNNPTPMPKTQFTIH